MAKIKSDAHLYLTIGGATPPAVQPVASVTKADPAVVIMGEALPPGTANDDMIKFAGTGEPLLDGKAFRIANISAPEPGNPTFNLIDFDGTRMIAAVTSGTAQIMPKGGDDSVLLEVCMVTITVAGVPPDSIPLDDMCGSTTVLGSPKPPTFTYTGFVDKESPGFQNLMRASLESPKTLRYMLVDYTVGGGYIFGPVQIGEITITAQTAQGLQFSGTGVFTEMPTYSWAL